MKYIKLFEEFGKKDTRLVSDVNATDVVSYFDRNVEGVGAQFIDFDTVELIVYNSEDMTQDEIEERLDSAEDTIFNVHLKNDRK